MSTKTINKHSMEYLSNVLLEIILLNDSPKLINEICGNNEDKFSILISDFDREEFADAVTNHFANVLKHSRQLVGCDTDTDASMFEDTKQTFIRN